MKKITYLIILLIFLIPIVRAAPPPMPVGVAGMVTIDGVPTNEVEVVVQNLNTGETIQTHTRKAQDENGWYVCAVGGKDGDTIRATVNYNGQSYSREITVDLNRTTHYINFTISSHTSSSSSPREYSPPSANFIWSPDQPKVNEIVTFVDMSSDPDGDIVSTYWEIAGHNFTGHGVQYTFPESGNFTISLVVMDAKGYIDACQKTIYVAPSDSPSSEPPSSVNETFTSNQTEKTNITLFIEVKDKNGNPLPHAKVEIYQNNTLVQTAYTNEDGTATVEIQPGSYKIKTSYASQIETKRMSFVNDGRVTFLFSHEEQTRTKSFNWWWIIIPLVVIAIVVILILRGRRPWWI